MSHPHNLRRRGRVEEALGDVVDGHVGGGAREHALRSKGLRVGEGKSAFNLTEASSELLV